MLLCDAAVPNMNDAQFNEKLPRSVTDRAWIHRPRRGDGRAPFLSVLVGMTEHDALPLGQARSVRGGLQR